MKLSAVVLTYNEEKQISDCLRTLKFCDEVLVIDSGSTDKTVKLASQLHGDVYYHPFKDFSAARNFGLNKAKGEWVLFIDADERVPDKLQKEIIQKIGNGTKENGFYFRRGDFVFGQWLKYGETAKVRLLRLGRKGKGQWQRTVHETWEIEGLKGEFRTPLEHYSHQTVEEFMKKINFYSSFDAREYFDQGIKVQTWHLFAYPVGKFLKNYFYLQGFRDGAVGLVFAMLMSVNSFLIRSKLYLMWRKHAARD